MGNLISASAVSLAYKKVYNTIIKPKRNDGHHRRSKRTYCQCGIVTVVSSKQSTSDKRSLDESVHNVERPCGVSANEAPSAQPVPVVTES